ncbi:RNase P modulator RnpM [Lachnospiraceae bacterium YH-ros2228]|jgi:predicted RNA-binding protein YlxR (DUF448 family)|nr:YlxR family protein [Lachnospiraceae bacterium]MDD6449958.1 YlxR family protein [Lachnospiraceae bacterium]MDD6451697.1 YlxR family protein [Lachnospiraceae bacterium]MDD6578514.1 YlxR family protein [Lachnospiraceae bacterium]
MTKNKRPLRRCVACGNIRDPREMFRLVRKTDGSVSLDPTGRENGRGAYLCKSESCLDKAIQKKLIERSLKAAVDPAVYDQVRKELEQ